MFYSIISIPYGSIKSYSNRIEVLITYISIPYGSIKRKIVFKVTYLLLISIPYGSIKRISLPTNDSCICPFQFLMVRLKEQSKSRTQRTGGFQFLMVRLKASILKRNDAACLYFNSLWFD